MHSLEQRYTILTATARKLGHDPDPEQLQRLRTELDELDRALDDVPAGERRYRLSLASRAANSCLTEAADRARGVRRAAAATVERESNDARHPTVLSPRSALADWKPGKPRDRGMER
ncbi:hypothetical protein [Nocardia noduli]|uniref:hypothetical protein n=1 Tax=Nocardia noduli TaxID=2815722 RepID=UPI001C24E756|nr:hypothetical protein [Nocardia noduli]